ncbi:glycosyltransferase [Ureibacillus acetophenoni]
MNKAPKISIITACYNAEKTIEQTIQSVIYQTYDNIEYIIVDGASNDGTMEIVNKYNDQIDIIISEPDEGIYDAFNKGAKKASGEYIYYLNADDFLYNHEVIANVTQHLVSSNKDIKLLYGGVKVLKEKTGFFYFDNEKRNLDSLINRNMIPHQSIFMKRDILLEFNLFNVNYKIAADYDLICKIFLRYEHLIEYVDLIIAVFRVGGISSDLKNMKLMIDEYSNISNEVFGQHKFQSYYPSTEKLLKIWLENIVFYDKSIFSNSLLNRKKIAIWGTGEVAILLLSEATKHSMEVLCFIDNNAQKHNEFINSIPIHSPTYLDQNDEIDSIIFGFEGSHEESVKLQLKNLNIRKDVINWKDLVIEMDGEY